MRDCDLNGGRGPYVGGPYVRKGLDMIQDNSLGDFAHRIDAWLLLAVDPGTRRFEGEGCTITDLAKLFGKKDRKTMRAALDELAEHGRIKFEMSKGRGTGWIEVLDYDDRLAYNVRTRELRTKAYLDGVLNDDAVLRTPREVGNQTPTSGREVGNQTPTTAGETPKSLLDSLSVPKRRVPAGAPRPRLRSRPARLRRRRLVRAA